MKKNICVVVLLIAVLSMAVSVGASGPVDSNYHIHRGTAAAASGGVSTSASYVSYSTIGQISTDFSAESGGDQAASGGIWRGVSASNVLVLEKTFRDALVEANDELVFVVAVTNNGYRAQNNVVVTDTIPSGLTFVPDSVAANLKGGEVSADIVSDTIAMTIPQLSYEQIAVLTYRAVVSADEGAVITNTAFAASETYGPIEASAVIHVVKPHRVYLPLVMRSGSSEATPEPEVHVLNDTSDVCGAAHPIVLGDLYQESFDHENDNDWYSFEAVAGQTYDIKTGDLEERSDTIIVLYDGDCETQLAENDDISWPHNVASEIVWTATESGRLHVMVRSYDWRVYGEDTGYTFSVEVLDRPANQIQAEPVEPSDGDEDSLDQKPPPLPTPMPGNVDRSSRRSPGLASFVEQKSTPPPTPDKPPPEPTPGPDENEPTVQPTEEPVTQPTVQPQAPAPTSPPPPLLPESGVESTENENSDAGTDVEGVILAFGAVSALVLFFTGVLAYNAISVSLERAIEG